jgi:hypothetical protein
LYARPVQHIQRLDATGDFQRHLANVVDGELVVDKVWVYTRSITALIVIRIFFLVIVIIALFRSIQNLGFLCRGILCLDNLQNSPRYVVVAAEEGYG